MNQLMICFLVKITLCIGLIKYIGIIFKINFVDQSKVNFLLIKITFSKNDFLNILDLCYYRESSMNIKITYDV